MPRMVSVRGSSRAKYLAAIAGLAVMATPAAAQIKADAVRIGVLTDMAGIFATAMGPGSVEAAKMAAEEFGNKINGKPIQIFSTPITRTSPMWQHRLHGSGSTVTACRRSRTAAASAASLAVQELVRATNRIFLVSGAGAVELTERACAPTSVQWTHDATSTANAVVAGVSKTLKGSWFFITADYAFGHGVEATARAKLDKLGIKVAGSVKTPLNTADFSSYLLQAQAAGAKVLALNAAGDNVTAMKQANEFGFPQQGIAIVPMSFQNVDIVAAGLQVTKGQLIATSFFEDVSAVARKWSDEFFARRRAMPSQIQAGVYSAVRHYLQAVKDTDSDDGPTVMARMKATRVSDAFTPDGMIRADQRMVHDMYVVQVKTPAESKGPWDLVKLITTVPPEEAFRPLSESKCPLVAR